MASAETIKEIENEFLVKDADKPSYSINHDLILIYEYAEAFCIEPRVVRDTVSEVELLRFAAYRKAKRLLDAKSIRKSQ